MVDPNFDIWRMQAQGDVRALIEVLRSGDIELRKRAATALRALGASSAIPALQTILVAETDPELRTILISTLDSLFQQEMDEDGENSVDEHSQIVRLISQLSGSQHEHIIRAAQTLGELKEKIAAEALMMVFHNQKMPSRVRLAAAEALIQLESAPVEVTLLATLRHKDWRVRRNTAAVLGQLNADWAVEPLAAALRDPQEIVRRTAYAALKRINTPEALQAITPPKAVTRPLSPRILEEMLANPPAKPESAPQTPLPEISLLTPKPAPVEVKPPEVEPPPVEVKTPTQVVLPTPELPPVPNPPAPEVKAPVSEPPTVTATNPVPPVAADSSPDQSQPLPAVFAKLKNLPDDEDTQPTPLTLLGDDVS